MKTIRLPNKSFKVLVLLLSTDLFFILLHIAHKIVRILNAYPLLEKDYFNIYLDLNVAEPFQYVKEFWIILLLGWMIFKGRKFFFSGWWLMSIYLLFDDLFNIHGELGTFALEALNISPSHIITGQLRYQDFGEFGISLFFGTIFFSIITYFYLHGSKDTRTIFHYLAGAILFIVFFGVVHDLANRIFDEATNKIMFEITRLIEEGGEMISMSILCWYVYTLTEPDPPSAPS